MATDTENIRPEINFTEVEDRICAECAHLVGRRTYVEDARNWKCHAKQNLVSAEKDQVTGGMVYTLRFPTCYDARAEAPSAQIDMRNCGPLGAWFEKYKYEAYRQTDYPPRKKGVEAVNVDDLLKELE